MILTYVQSISIISDYVKNLGGICDRDGREVTKGRNINHKLRLIFISTTFKKFSCSRKFCFVVVQRLKVNFQKLKKKSLSISN